MSCDDKTNRAWWIALLVLVLIGAGVWALYLYGSASVYPTHDPALSQGGRRVIDGEMLSGGRDETSPRATDLEARPGAEDGPSGRAQGPVTIHALGPTGASLVDVTVTLFEEVEGKTKARDAQTDARGRVTFADVRLDGSARAVLLYNEHNWGPGSAECASAKITSGAAELRSRCGLPLVFRLVRADRAGTSPDTDILIRPYFCGLPGEPPFAATAVAIEPGPLTRVGAKWETVSRYAGRTSPVMLFPFPPDVQEAHGIRPLWREAEVVLVATADQRLPQARPKSAIITMGRKEFERSEFEIDGFGRIRVSGVPFQPYLPVGALITFEDGSVGVGRARSGPGPSVSIIIELEISEGEEPVIRDEEIEDHEEFGPSESREPGASAGKLSLQLMRIDGTPGKDAWAVLRPLDGGPNNWRKASEQGVVTWERWHAGRFELSVWGIGATHTQEIEVVAGKETVESIQGTVGGRVRVEVRDQEGRVLPYAWVRLTDHDVFRHADVKGARLRIDPYTDRMGNRTFHRVRPGKVEVRAIYGGYAVRGEAEVRANRTVELELVLDLSK